MAYGIAALNKSLNSNPLLSLLSSKGRGGDTMMAHLTPGEMVLPHSVQRPGIMALIAKEMRSKGIKPESRVVGSKFAQKNPSTGAQEFYDPLLDEGWSGGEGTTSGQVSDYVTSGGVESQGYGDYSGYQQAYDEDAYDAGPMVAPNPLADIIINTPEKLPSDMGIGKGSIGSMPADSGMWDYITAVYDAFRAPGPVGEYVGGIPGRVTDAIISQIPGLGLVYNAGSALNQLFGPGQSGPYNPDDYAANAHDATNEDPNTVQGIYTTGNPTAAPVQPTQPTLSPQLPVGIAGPAFNPIPPSIDYYNYAYGPEVLMYPWLTSGGTSYGRYPLNLTA